MVASALALAGCPGAPRGAAPLDPSIDAPAVTTGAWSDPAAPDGAIGADASLVVEAMAADGSWVRLCQAQDTDHDGRRASSYVGNGYVVGDRMYSTLVLGSGEGREIDATLAVSPDERRLAVWRTGGLHLIDVRRRAVTEVTAVLATAAEPPPIAAAFTADGAWLAWSLGARLTAHDLATGAERAIDLGDLGGGRIWAIDAATAGAWVRVAVVRRDTDGDGRVAAQWGISDSNPGPCAHPWDGGSFGAIGDEPELAWIELATGKRQAELPPGATVAAPPPPHTVGAIGADRVAAIDARGRRLLVTTPPTDRAPARGPLRWAP